MKPVFSRSLIEAELAGRHAASSRCNSSESNTKGITARTAAVRAVIPFVFDSLELHRLEAACLPTNTASIKLLEKTGFKREGLARRYLRINGVWQDHLLYALLDTDTHP